MTLLTTTGYTHILITQSLLAFQTHYRSSWVTSTHYVIQVLINQIRHLNIKSPQKSFNCFNIKTLLTLIDSFIQTKGHIPGKVVRTIAYRRVLITFGFLMII